MLERVLLSAILVVSLATAHALGQAVPAFDASRLVKLGDTVKYGSYEIVKIGEGIYQLKDFGDPKARGGGFVGADMYLICGTTRALLIDLGNNGIDGYAGDPTASGNNAAGELLAAIDGLDGKLPLEIAITHARPDYAGMTRAFLDRKTVIWLPRGETVPSAKAQHDIDPAVYTLFDPAAKRFDLGDGRVVQPLPVRGHTSGCTVYLLPSEMLLFTGDCLGIGAGASIRDAAQLKVFAEDAQRLVYNIRAGFRPYERYALRVYTGHTRGNAIRGFVSPSHGVVDIEYLDWRFVQDQALCAIAILKGQWLNPESGLRYVEVTNPATGLKTSLMLYGIGAIGIPIQEAYAAAGLKMAQQEIGK